MEECLPIQKKRFEMTPDETKVFEKLLRGGELIASRTDGRAPLISDDGGSGYYLEHPLIRAAHIAYA